MTLMLPRANRPVPHRAVPSYTGGGRRGLCSDCGRGCHLVQPRIGWLPAWWRHDPRRTRRTAPVAEGVLL